MLMEISKQKKRPQLETKKNYKMEKLTSKGKHIVEAGNGSQAKLTGRLKDKSGKILYVHNKH